MAKQNIMTVASLKNLLKQIEHEISDDYEIWLASDEEGNAYLPMFEDTRLSLGVDKDGKKIVFFPSHR
jgi:hypothetical protein